MNEKKDFQQMKLLFPIIAFSAVGGFVLGILQGFWGTFLVAVAVAALLLFLARRR